MKSVTEDILEGVTEIIKKYIKPGMVLSHNNEFEHYQLTAAKTAIYDKNEMERDVNNGDHLSLKGLSYVTLGLSGEAGEVANKVKKLIRDYNETDELPKAKLDEIADELGDVLWYLAMVAQELNVSLEDIANNNLTKLHSRKERGTLQGSGDKR